MPLLLNITKPSLLIPGYIQVVPKAQRIYLEPGEEQDGVWHQDGNEEHVIAVVIYYSRVEGYEGGNIEFMERTGKAFQVNEDSVPDPRQMKRCKVESKSGRLLVFSNYQNVHRVLKMVNKGDSVAQRDQIILFVIDQRQPLTSTNDTEQHKIIKKSNIDLHSLYDRRDEKFRNQIKPVRFGPNRELCQSTGNGTAAQILFQHYKQSGQSLESEYFKSLIGQDKINQNHIQNINKHPPENRGISQTFTSSSQDRISGSDQ